jgi:MarR family transcriptional regulator, organic hydroperoxide resistance regulator
MNKKDIGFRIKKINDLLCKNGGESMMEMGVTFSQHHVLVYLVHQDDSTSTLKDLERDFRVSQATMSGIIKRMEEKHFVHTFLCDHDKRVKFVQLTDLGKKLCVESNKLMKRNEQKMRSLYTEEEMIMFEEYLDRLFIALDKEDQKC